MSPDGHRSGRKAPTRTDTGWPDDLHDFVCRHLVSFAAEFHWTPATVWDLQLWQLVEFGVYFDKLKAARKRAAETPAPARRKRRR